MSEQLEELVDIVYEGLCGPASIPVKLRNREGLSSAQLENVYRALATLADLYQGQQLLPKRLVYALIDLTNSMNAARGAYEEDVQDQIEDAAERLVDLAYRVAEE